MIEQHNAMQQVHRDRELECSKCQRAFLTKGKLGRHVQGVHRLILSQQEVQNYVSEEHMEENVNKTREIEYTSIFVKKFLLDKQLLRSIKISTKKKTNKSVNIVANNSRRFQILNNI